MFVILCLFSKPLALIFQYLKIPFMRYLLKTTKVTHCVTERNKMLHYSTTLDGYPCLWREPKEIREELCELRDLWQQAKKHMELLESKKEELLLTLSEEEDYRDGEKIRLLETLCEECEEQKEALTSLSESLDLLNEELRESIWFMRGSLIE